MALGEDTRGKVTEVCIVECLENLQSAASRSNGAEYAMLFFYFLQKAHRFDHFIAIFPNTWHRWRFKEYAKQRVPVV